MYVDNIKLIVRNVKELDIFIQAIRIFSQYIQIAFGLEKWAMQIMRSKKRRQITKETELPRSVRNLRRGLVGDLWWCNC